MKCYIGIVLFAYNYMMISSQVLSDDEKTSYIGIDNGTRITECVLVSSRDSYVKHYCPENMALYPLPNEMDVVMCDCKREFLYFPLNDSCYKPYRQGPCSSKNYLVLPENEAVSRCVKNPCLKDGMVPYNGECYSLQTKGPCNLADKLEVDTRTFQLRCMPRRTNHTTGIPYRIKYIMSNFSKIFRQRCSPGSRRILKYEACKPALYN